MSLVSVHVCVAGLCIAKKLGMPASKSFDFRNHLRAAETRLRQAEVAQSSSAVLKSSGESEKAEVHCLFF